MPTGTRPTPTRTAPTPDVPAGASASLARCVGDVEAFLARHFTTAPHRWHGGRFDDLLSLADVDAELTGGGLRRPAVRLVRDGQGIDPSRWTTRARTGGTWVDDLVDPARALSLFADGATIVLQSLQRWWPPLGRFCRDLEAGLGHPIQANAYLTPTGAAGLAPHHDTHDVFVLQVHGSKHWVVREPLVDQPLARHRSRPEAAAASPVRFEAELAPGDCLYLPRGTIHSATTQRGASLHLTVGVLARTRHDLLRHVLDLAAEEPAFRRALPGGWGDDPDLAAGSTKEVLTELIRWLESLDAASVAAGLPSPPTCRRPPTSGGLLLDLAALEEIDDRSVVEPRPGAVRRTELAEGRLRLSLVDRVLDLPAGVEGPVRDLLAGGARRVGDLADRMDGPSRLVLVRRLVREGVLRTTRGS